MGRRRAVRQAVVTPRPPGILVNDRPQPISGLSYIEELHAEYAKNTIFEQPGQFLMQDKDGRSWIQADLWTPPRK